MLDDLIRAVIRFRDERDWKQFHTPKDLAISITLEAAELLERFQWKGGEEVVNALREPGFRESIGEEMADV